MSDSLEKKMQEELDRLKSKKEVKKNITITPSKTTKHTDSGRRITITPRSNTPANRTVTLPTENPPRGHEYHSRGNAASEELNDYPDTGNTYQSGTGTGYGERIYEQPQDTGAGRGRFRFNFSSRGQADPAQILRWILLSVTIIAGLAILLNFKKVTFSIFAFITNLLSGLFSFLIIVFIIVLVILYLTRWRRPRR